MTKKDGDWWIEKLKNEGLSAIESLYLEWRTDFLDFARRYQPSDEDALDAYQDALVIFYENIVSGKLEKLTSSAKTYLFSVGKYTLLNKLKAKNKYIPLEVEDKLHNVNKEDVEYNLNEREEKVYQLLKQLGPRCQQLIELFYFQKLSIKTIAQQLKLKNENTVKAHKSRCIKSLRDKMK